MPRSVPGPLNTKRKGSATCTRTGGTLHFDGMKFGPDGNDWVAYETLKDVVQLCGEVDQIESFLGFRHVGKPGFDHLCASKGGWAFEVFSSSLPKSVIFLHIRPPKKLADALVGGPNLYRFSTNDLLVAFAHAKYGSRAPRVWRRNVVGWDEIAVNFCLRNT